MKILNLLFIVPLLLANLSNAQTVTAYFSNTHFEAGKESENAVVDQFTDADNIYGLLVIDKELYCEDEDPSRPMSDFSIKISVFDGATNGLSSVSLNYVERFNGKTYVFLDMLPETQFAVSKSCKEFGYKIAKIKTKVNGKISILGIEGSCVNLEPIKIKGATIKVKRTGVASSEFDQKISSALARIEEAEYENYNKATLKKMAQQDENDKLTGTLPKEFDTKNEVRFEKTSQEDFIKLVRASKWFPEGSTFLDYSAFNYKETKVNGTNMMDHVSYEFYVSFKDKDGFCRYRKMYTQQNYSNGVAETPTISCFGSQYLWGKDAAEIAKKEGSRIFFYNCK